MPVPFSSGEVQDKYSDENGKIGFQDFDYLLGDSEKVPHLQNQN